MESNGCLGVTGQAVLPLSRGRRIVSHLLDVNAVDRSCACHPPLTGASFTLGHRLTGIRLTPELFATAEFRCGTVPRG